MKKHLFASLAALSAAATLAAQERPNIVVFLVDDMGLMDTSVPFITDRNGEPQRQPLNDWYRTPKWNGWPRRVSASLPSTPKASARPRARPS